MIVPFGENLSQKEVKELAARLEGRKILQLEYEHMGADNYYTLKLDDDTKLTIYYEDKKGSLTLGEGFP